MSLTERERRELSDLASSATDGRLTTTDLARLEEILRTSADARHYYVRFMDVSAGLAWAARDESALAPALNFATRTAQESAQRRGWWTATAAAAALAFAILGIWAFARPTAPSTFTPPVGIATLSTAVNVEWADAQEPGHVGNLLQPGWIRMKSGLAQIDFINGASVWLEGPVEVRLDSPREAFCASGKVVAQVPRTAADFRLASPCLTVQQKGTGFGVEVGKDNRDTLHVFRGTVDVTLRTNQSKTAVAAGQSFSADRAGTTSIAAADPNTFSREEFGGAWGGWNTHPFGTPPWMYGPMTYTSLSPWGRPMGPPPAVYPGIWKGADPMDPVRDLLGCTDDRWSVIKKPLEEFLTEQWHSWGMDMNPNDMVSRARMNLQFALEDTRTSADDEGSDQEIAKRLTALREARLASQASLKAKEEVLHRLLRDDEQAKLVTQGYMP